MVIPNVHFEKFLYIRAAFQRDSFKSIVKMVKQNNIDCHKLFKGRINIFAMNCYNILIYYYV